MKKLGLLLSAIILHLTVFAQGWPMDYDGVMMQGFYWDSYSETSWAKLEAQADEIAPYFQLIWIPQSGWCNSDYTMGYMPVYYFDQKSAFGSESQLRSMIDTYRKKGTGFIADVVLNHRKNIGKDGSWVDFPEETYNGVTYQMYPSDICKNDDGGATGNWASSHGISLSENDDTGDDWSSCRDLDHNSQNVQDYIKAYLNFLLNDIGYVGFRYDMVKGFYASFVGEYNMAARPAFSVGEYFDGTSNIKQWIDFTKGYVAEYPTSGAFDFGFRYRMIDAVNNQKWRYLGEGDPPLISDNYYKQYAITFVENHDTENRINGDVQNPIYRDTLAANAYMLAMPGTPCVFYRHWADCKYPLKQMILARRLAGITNTSGAEEKWRDDKYYAKAVYGKNATLICVVGSNPDGYGVSTSDYRKILSGKGYRYYLSRNANTVWMDVPDGTYEGSIQVKFTAVSNYTGFRIVYTTDGSDPTSESNTITSGSTLSIESSCTLKAGILHGGKVYGIQTRKYNIFVPHDITLYVRSDVTWSAMSFYVWDNLDNKPNGNWPGKRVRDTKEIGGKTWNYQTYHLSSADQYLNLIVTNTAGSRQTIDVRGIRSDRFFCITGDKDGSNFIIEDQTDDMATGIEELGNFTPSPFNNSAFNLQGMSVPQGKKKGIIIENGRKTLYK